MSVEKNDVRCYVMDMAGGRTEVTCDVTLFALTG